MASLSGFTLPEIKDSDLNDEKQRRQILEYLYQLTEQLRFTLSNLDEENFSDTVTDNIQGAYTAASSASKEVKDMGGNVSRLKQFADTLTLEVSNGSTSSTIALMANNAQISSQEIIIKGFVTFADLSGAGRTTINGSNIKTGTIDADLIDVDNLYVKYLEGAEGTFEELDASGGRVHLGQDYIDINGVEIGYMSGYSDLCVIPDGAGVGNVGVGNYYWDQVKANNHPTASSLRYKKNVSNITDEEIGNIDDIRPVTYELKNKDDGKKYPGFIAEELADIAPLFVSFDDEGLPESIDYSRIVVMLVHEIKKLRKRVAALEEKEE